MAEKVDEKKVEKIEDDTQTEEVSTDEVVKTEKTFDQNQVNRIVQSRLKSVKEDYDTQISGLNAQIQELENVLKAQVEEWKKDLPEDYAELLADQPIAKQWKVLSKKQNQVAKEDMTSVTVVQSEAES